jgi:hypothetical protein
MATIHVKYRCDECGEIHEEESDARGCCPPEISEIFYCSVCHAEFYDELDADEHCNTHNDDEPDVPTKAELEAAGQMRLEI